MSDKPHVAQRKEPRIKLQKVYIFKSEKKGYTEIYKIKHAASTEKQSTAKEGKGKKNTYLRI